MNAANAGQQRGKHVTTVKDTQATVEEILEATTIYLFSIK
jgi:hypothetical protein